MYMVILQSESEKHFCSQVADEDISQVLSELFNGDVLLRLSPDEHVQEPIPNDTWELAVLNKYYPVNS